MNHESISARLTGYQTILQAVAEAPAGQLFLASYEPADEEGCREVTFGRFARLTSRVRAFYEAEGVAAGDTVALMMDQGPLLMAAFVAAMQLGALPTILAYPTFKVDPAKYRHGLAGVTGTIRPRLVVVDRAYPEELKGIIEGEVRVVDATRLPTPGSAGPMAPLAGSAPAFLQHSAGTTGLQKGVVLPHRAVLKQLVQLVDTLRLTPEDRIVSWLPLYHDMGLVACFVLPLVCHLPVVMMSPTQWVLQPQTFLQLAAARRATVGWLPNFAFQLMARRVPDEVRRELDLGSLRLLINCSEPVRARSLDEFQAFFASCGLGSEVLQTSWAMAENTFAVTQSPIGSRPARTVVSRAGLRERDVVESPADAADRLELVSSGVPLEGCEVQVVDVFSRVPVGDGTVGELLVRSDCLFEGYFNRPGVTAAAFDDDGWYRTGDLGFRLGDEVYVLGRRDDVIVIGGSNVFPEDVEAAAARHPAVRDGRVAAFGVESPELGTRELVVVAELQSDEADRDPVALWIREEVLAEVGVAPRTVRLVEAGWMVKSTAGKPARSACRAKHLGEAAGRA